MSARGLKQNSIESTPSSSSSDAEMKAALIAGELPARREEKVSTAPVLGPIEGAPISGKWLSVVSGANPVHMTDESGESPPRPATKAVRDKELELLSPELMRLFKEP